MTTPKIKAVREAVAYVRGILDNMSPTHPKFEEAVEVLEKHAAELDMGAAHGEQWKVAVSIALRDEGLDAIADKVWDEDDPCDVHDAASDAYDDGEDPFDFVQEAFAEDIARAKNEAAVAGEERGFR